MVIPDRADVIVVGGGPAGSSTAIRLARSGLNVTLLDRARFPREKACAEYCSPGVVDALEDLGALERIHTLDHRQLDGMQVVARGQRIPLEFERDRPGENRAIGIKRSILDEGLIHLAAETGVNILEETRAIRPAIEDGRIAGVVCKSGGTERTIQARFVVVADGLHSTLVRALGLERTVRWPRRLGLVARFSGMPEPILHGQMHIGDGFYCGLSPVTATEANVSLVVPLGSKPGHQTSGDYFDETIRKLPGIDRLLGDAERISNVRGLGPMGKRVRKVSGRGYLLVGDAAGFFDPLTGEGIHRALDGGKLAAQAVLRAMNRDDRRPTGYRQARSREFGDKERVCRIIQLLLQSPAALDYVSSRAMHREQVSQPLRGILGDYRPAREAFQPSFLWNLFRP
ncbi:MAG: NAD(P)/FAD-dependent oxidoreductase [Thermomicrobiaceae bacterium]